MPALENMRHERWCHEYLTDYSATNAALRCGYAKNSASQTGYAIKNRPEVQMRLEEIEKERLSKIKITGERVLREMATIAFTNIRDFICIQEDGSSYVDLSRATRARFAAISEVHSETYMDGRGEDAREVKKIKIKLADKQAALEKIGRHLGLWKSDMSEAATTIADFITQMQAKGSEMPVENVPDGDGNTTDGDVIDDMA